MATKKGSPGTIMTFFPYPDIPKGRKGKGQLTTTSFSISENSLDYWMKRLNKFGIAYEGPRQRFDELFIYFEDQDGLGLELVTSQEDKREGFTYGNVPSEFAIKGFYGVSLLEECYEKTAGLLVGQMDHVLIAEKGNRFRYSSTKNPGDFIDLLCCPDSLKGLAGSGTVHHIAFATSNDTDQLEAREKLLRFGLNVTPVLDREYFHSIYFKEPGGVLFEIATALPGFTADEPLEHLGETLKLPPWEEKNRARIEKALPSLQLNLEEYTNC